MSRRINLDSPRLELRIAPKSKQLAERLALHRRQSVSGLFEILLEEEERRISGLTVPPTRNKPLDPYASQTRKNQPTRIRNKAGQSKDGSQ